MVNLVTKKGYQKRLGEKFQEVFNESRFKDDFEYVWFDYHAQCKGMKVENCAKLIKGIQGRINQVGWMEAIYQNSNLILIPFYYFRFKVNSF
jgi:hypothetical protein